MCEKYVILLYSGVSQIPKKIAKGTHLLLKFTISGSFCCHRFGGWHPQSENSISSRMRLPHFHGKKQRMLLLSKILAFSMTAFIDFLMICNKEYSIIIFLIVLHDGTFFQVVSLCEKKSGNTCSLFSVSVLGRNHAKKSSNDKHPVSRHAWRFFAMPLLRVALLVACSWHKKQAEKQNLGWWWWWRKYE